jgi:lipopolysaccharide export system protein LptA
VRRSAFLALCLCLGAARALSAETFTFSSDRVESVMAQGKERTVLTGRVRITSGTLAIKADRVELVGKDSDLLLCTGAVVADDSDRAIHLETPSLRYERKRKFSHMEGASVLVDKKNKVVLKALWIENSGETDITVAQVNVRILKDKLACRSEYALYRRAEKILELSGAPSVYKEGDNYRASRIVVNTDSEEIKLEGDVAGSIQSSDDKKGADSQKGGPEAAAPAGSEPAAVPSQPSAPPPAPASAAPDSTGGSQ